MRGFAGLLAYLVGVSAIICIGIVGLMALQSLTERTPPPTVAALHKERPAKPIRQPINGQKTAHPNQKHTTVHVTHKQPHEALPIDAGRNAYGYAEEPRRIDPNRFPFFGR
jgi:hypothetical protein